MYNYHVTLNKPTAVVKSLVGNFTSPDERNLILNKCTRLEIYTLSDQGLFPLIDVPVYGRMSWIELFRPAQSQQDFLFLMTEKNFCVLYYDKNKEEIITRAYGSLEDGMRPSEITLAVIDPELRLIGLYINQGTFKVIPCDSKTGKLKEAYNIRIDESQILDIKFLDGYVRPAIVVLYQDHKESRHIKSYEILLDSQEFIEGSLWIPNVESGASMVITLPKPFGGLIVIGEQSIVYKGGENFKSIPMKTTLMSTWKNIDKNYSRILLGDMSGNLWILILHNDGINVTELTLELIGETSILSTISYLDNGVIFAGSTQGDSHLIELKSDKNEETGQYIDILETYTNLGPILDFCHVKKQGHDIVACSGAYKSGSIRIIRQGIGLTEYAVVDLPGIKGLWSVTPPSSSTNDKYLIISYAMESRILSMKGEEIEEVTIPSFKSEQQTLYCGNIKSSSYIIQITGKGIYVIDIENHVQVSEWTPPDGKSINVCNCNLNQVAVAISKTVAIFDINGGDLKLIGTKEMENEISCIDITPFGGLPSREEKAMYCVVGLWGDMSVHILETSSLKEIAVEFLGGDIIPRSALFMTFDDIDYLFVSLGDGSLFNFVFNPSENEVLTNRKKITLGTHPVTLNRFISKDQYHIFACSDRPTVIYSNNKKILYSGVNLKEVSYMCELNTETFQDSMALATESQLIIGSADDIQKLHIRTIYLQEMARRICHCPYTQTFCVLTLKYDINESGEEVESSYMRILDDTTLEVLDSYKFDTYEIGSSVTQIKFEGSDSKDSFYAVGTAYAHPEEDAPRKGRIIVFRVIDLKIVILCEIQVNGAVYSLTPFNGKLAAAVNSVVELYNWTSSHGLTYSLKLESEEGGNVLVQQLATKGDFIVYADLMRSMTLLSYSQVDGKLRRIASHLVPLYLTSVAMPDTDIFYASDNDFNLYAIQYNSGASNEDERYSLEVIGCFHTGELVFNIKEAKLSDLTENNNSMIYCSTSGAIGLISTISEEDYHFFEKLSASMNEVLKTGLGGFSNEKWRTVTSYDRCQPRKGFVDGDLIESYIDLRKEDMELIAKLMEMSSEEVTRRIESVSQSLH